MEQILEWIADQIRNDYIAGYYPARAGEKRMHTVQVVLRDLKRGQVIGGSRQVEY